MRSIRPSGRTKRSTVVTHTCLPVESSGVSVDGASRHEGVADVLEAPPNALRRRRRRRGGLASSAADGRPRPGQGFLDRADAHLIMHTYVDRRPDQIKRDETTIISRRVS